MRVLHTDCHERGQIYVPMVNWLLALATLGAVVGFGSSDALAGAYGIAVSLLIEGGWFPLLRAAIVAFVMLTWRQGALLLEAAPARVRQPAAEFMRMLLERPLMSARADAETRCAALPASLLALLVRCGHGVAGHRRQALKNATRDHLRTGLTGRARGA